MPVSKPKSPPKRVSKSKSRTVKPKKQPAKSVQQSSKKKQPPPQRTPTFWGSLSIDRRLDLIGIALTLAGLLTLLSLVSVERSVLTGGLILFLGQLFGWGLYIPPG